MEVNNRRSREYSVGEGRERAKNSWPPVVSDCPGAAVDKEAG